MGKRLIREHILMTRTLVGLPWHEAVKLFLRQERQLRAYKYVMLRYPSHHADGEPYAIGHGVTDEEHAEVIALIAAPLSHARHVERISEVMEKVAMRYSDAMVVYRKEDTRETELRRTAAAKAERQRIRKLPRQGT